MTLGVWAFSWEIGKRGNAGACESLLFSRKRLRIGTGGDGRSPEIMLDEMDILFGCCCYIASAFVDVTYHVA
jgi:hypothetical protein